MVENGILNPDDSIDLFCLHLVTFDLLQRSLNEFKISWNNHSLRTEGEKTPRQLFIAGMAQLLQFQSGRPLFTELKRFDITFSLSSGICKFTSFFVGCRH